jgi:small neutral amino acid transporter SnatA (MarC family)
MTLRSAVFVIVATDTFDSALFVARVRARVAAGVAGLVGAAVLLAVACTWGPTLLDHLRITAEAAEIAAGVVLLVPALTLCVTGQQLTLLECEPADASGWQGGWRGGLVPVALPFLAGPAPLAVVVALADRQGRGDVAFAVTLALVVAAAVVALACGRPRAGAISVGARVAGRFVGAATVLVAFALIVDGVLGV